MENIRYKSQNAKQEIPKRLITLIWNVSVRECERRGIRVRLGGNSCPISAMSDGHHRYGKQGVPTNSGKVRSSIKFDYDKCRLNKYLYYFFMGLPPLVSSGFLRVEGSLSQSDTPHSVQQCLTRLLNTDRRRIPEDWLLRPTINVRPPKIQPAVLWILANFIMYRLQQRRTLSPQDYHDFLQRAKWKFYKTESRLKKVGNYLSIIGNDA